MMIKIKKDYLTAKAKYETVIKLKKQCQEKVLKENELYTTEGEKTNLLNDYLMTESDSIKYWKLCFAEYKKVGLNPKSWDDAIDWKYQKQLREAENALIKWGQSKIEKFLAYKENIEGIDKLYETINWNLDLRKKVIDLTMSLIEKKGEI